MLKVTPPKESMGGTKGHQIIAYEFNKMSYKYLVELDKFTSTEEFYELSQTERDLITSELKNQTKAYELLWARVDTY